MLVVLITAEVQHAGLFKPCLWGVQDMESRAIPRDSSRRSHSPHAARPHGGHPCHA